jgi:hypothetical protein
MVQAELEAVVVALDKQAVAAIIEVLDLVSYKKGVVVTV